MTSQVYRSSQGGLLTLRTLIILILGVFSAGGSGVPTWLVASTKLGGWASLFAGVSTGFFVMIGACVSPNVLVERE